MDNMAKKIEIDSFNYAKNRPSVHRINGIMRDAYERGATDQHNKFKQFLTHLCNTHVIDLHTPEQLIQMFQQNKFGE